MLKWFLLLSFMPIQLLSKPCTDSTIAKSIIKLGYGFGSPSIQLQDRYGSFGVINLAGMFSIKSIEAGPSVRYLFGSIVKEDVLAGLRSKEGDLIGSDHQLTEVDLRMRGIMFGVTMDKSFKINTSNHILVGLEPGWLAHWIRFQDQGNTFEPIIGYNKSGYDRLSSGFALSESFTYRYSSPSRLINFEVGMTLTQAWTHLRRSIQLDQPYRVFDTSRDGLFLITAKWLIPIFSRKNPDTIYY